MNEQKDFHSACDLHSLLAKEELFQREAGKAELHEHKAHVNAVAAIAEGRTLRIPAVPLRIANYTAAAREREAA
jgi:hypothetical protein